MTLRAIITVLMLVVSNIFMTCAWYGNLKLQDMKVLNDPPLVVVILLSWALAFFEYSVMIPANRLGYSGTGGPFSLVQGRALPLEPRRLVCLPGGRRLLRFQITTHNPRQDTNLPCPRHGAATIAPPGLPRGEACRGGNGIRCGVPFG